MTVQRNVTVAGTLLSPLGHLIPVLVISVIVLGGGIVGIYFGISSLLSDASTVSPEQTFTQPAETSIPEMAQNIPLIKEIEPNIVQTLKENTTAIQVFAETTLIPFEQMKVEWSIIADAKKADIPPRGEEPLPGTINVGDSTGGWTLSYSTQEREAWFNEYLSEINLNWAVVTGAKDGNTIFAVVNGGPKDPEKLSLGGTKEIRLLLSKDEGSTWFEVNVPDNWDKHIVGEIRVREENNNSTTLFISLSGRVWWTTSTN